MITIMASMKLNRRIPAHIRFSIVSLREKGFSCKLIAAKLLEQYDFAISSRGVHQYYSRFMKKRSVYDVRRKGRNPKLISPEIDKFVFDQMKLNNETTAYELQGKIWTKFKKTLSLMTIKRARRAQGWRYANVKYAQFVRAQNKPKRVKWCKNVLASGEKFLDIVFTDEMTVQLEQYRRRALCLKGDKIMIIRSRVKHPVKVHVWAGISARGATSIVLFPGKIRMDSQLFSRILKENYLPFASRTYAGKCRLQMDNAPVHVSKFTSAFLLKNGI